MSGPVVVIVSGPPCAGKSTIARRIAERFSFPLAGKDMFKELLFDTLGWQDRAWSRKLGFASIELLFQFLEAQLRARRSCIVESNFRPEYTTDRLLDLQGRYGFRLVQIQCVTQGDVLYARFKQRADSGERHPGHCDHATFEELRPQLLLGRMEPLDIGGVPIEIDTTDFGALDLDATLDRVARAIEGDAPSQAG